MALFVPIKLGEDSTNLHKEIRKQIKIHYFGDCWGASFCSCFDPATAAVAAAVIAAAAAPIFTPPAAFIALAILANAATPPTSIALNATVGFIAIFYLKVKWRWIHVKDFTFEGNVKRKEDSATTNLMLAPLCSLPCPSDLDIRSVMFKVAVRAQCGCSKRQRRFMY